MNIIEGGIASPIGFEAAGVEAQVKYENRKDMAIIYSQKPCVVAGTFTSNVVKAAPVKWDMDLVENSEYVQAVIVNTGIANAGTGKELSIKALTELVAKVVGYTGRIEWDTSRPNGTPRKLLDVSKATALGWTYKTELEDGIRLAYDDFLNNPMRAER